MSRRKSQAEQEREAQEADERASALAHKQSECGHYCCRPTEWHWSGQIREMTCDECGLVEYRMEIES